MSKRTGRRPLDGEKRAPRIDIVVTSATYEEIQRRVQATNGRRTRSEIVRDLIERGLQHG